MAQQQLHRQEQQYGLQFELDLKRALISFGCNTQTNHVWDQHKKNDLVLFGYRGPKFLRPVAIQLTFQTENAEKMTVFLHTRKRSKAQMVSVYVELPPHADPLIIATTILAFAHQAQTAEHPSVVGLTINLEGVGTTFDLSTRIEEIRASLLQRRHLRRQGTIVRAGPTFIVIKLTEYKRYDTKRVGDYRAYFGQIHDKVIQAWLKDTPAMMLQREVHFIPTATVSKFLVEHIPTATTSIYHTAQDVRLINPISFPPSK